MADIGQQLTQEITSVVESVGRSVVRVEARAHGGASGSIWAPGVVLATDHTLDRDEGIEIGFADGPTLPATLAGRDASLDLAVLRVEGELPPPPPWTEAASLKVGHPVLALARPGRMVRASLGIVAALGEAWRTGSGGRVDRYVQADVSLFRGFSGGVTADLQGRAIGIGTSALVRGLGLLLPTTTLRRVTEQILAHGAPRRGFIGIGTMPVRLSEHLAAKAGQKSALLVVSVQPGSPADRVPLILGDLVLGLAGRSVTQVPDLLAALEETAPGRSVAARLLRGGEVRDLEIEVGTRGA